MNAAGMGCREFDRSLKTGTSGIKANGHQDIHLRALIPDFDFPSRIEQFEMENPQRQKIIKLAHRASPGMRSALLAALEAWDMSSCLVDKNAVGLIVSGSNLNNQDVVEAYQRLILGRQVRPSYASQFLDSDYVGMISEALDIGGEGYCVGAASASGGAAIAMARRALLSGDLSAVVVVGAPTLLSSVEVSALRSVGALNIGNGEGSDIQPYQPFDQTASGFVYGQGAAALILEPLNDMKRSLAVLRASAMALDANHSTNPSVSGEVTVMKKALKQAGLEKEEIDLVNSHGTGSVLGDKVEAEALYSLFAKNSPWVNATKALSGHCLSSAGIVEAVAAVLQLRGGYLHANPALNNPVQGGIRWVGPERVEKDIRHILSNSFGFGGINTAQVFSHISTYHQE